jgi:PilZ domain
MLADQLLQPILEHPFLRTTGSRVRSLPRRRREWPGGRRARDAGLVRVLDNTGTRGGWPSQVCASYAGGVAKIELRRDGHRGSKVERRSKARYPIALDVRYIGREPPLAGAGSTLNISSSGMLIASHQQMSLGAQVEVCANWPFMRSGTTPLQFVAVGRVVRSESNGFALSFTRHKLEEA